MTKINIILGKAFSPICKPLKILLKIFNTSANNLKESQNYLKIKFKKENLYITSLHIIYLQIAWQEYQMAQVFVNLNYKVVNLMKVRENSTIKLMKTYFKINKLVFQLKYLFIHLYCQKNPKKWILLSFWEAVTILIKWLNKNLSTNLGKL